MERLTDILWKGGEKYVTTLGHNVRRMEALVRLAEYEDTGFSPGEIIEMATGKMDAKHGHWVGVEYDGYVDGNPVYLYEWECSECKEEMRRYEDDLTKYCPHCGAKMDAEENDGKEVRE